MKHTQLGWYGSAYEDVLGDLHGLDQCLLTDGARGPALAALLHRHPLSDHSRVTLQYDTVTREQWIKSLNWDHLKVT